jgi:hypothetical protein
MKPVHEVVGASVHQPDDGRVGIHTRNAEGATSRASRRVQAEKPRGSWALLVACLLAVGVLSGCGADASLGTLDQEERGRGEGNNQVIVDWIVHTDDLTSPMTPSNTPPRRSRTFAMVSVAMHDALNGIEPKYTRYASRVSDPDASPVAAAAQAAHDVLVALFPDKVDQLDDKLATSLGRVNGDHRRTRGVALGKAAAADLLSARASDGSNVVITYTPIEQLGFWRPTPPLKLPALEPNWGNVKPWGLASGSQFRSRAPYPLNSAEYLADFNEVRDYGSAGSTVRSTNQTHYALFWFEPSANGWNRLARTALDVQPKSIWKTARMFALMNMALADGYIASFDSKYFWQSWRPITFIQAPDDGNPATDQVLDWTPLRPTPPIPDQTSAHTVAGFAARAALVEVFGDDPGKPLTMGSSSVPGTRTWSTFTQAAAENADSRVMVGIHTRQSVVDGETQGRLVGDNVVGHRLRPLDD